MKNTLKYSLIGLSLLPLTAHAALTAGSTIGIDFNGSTNLTAAGFNGFSQDTNDGATATLSSLIDLTGAAVSGVTFSLENQSGQDTTRADFTTQGSEGTVAGPLSDQDVWDDAYISNNQGAAPLDPGGFFLLTFTGLDDSLTYDLTGGFDNNGGNSNFDAIWTADGQSFTTFTNSGAALGAGFGTLTGLTTDGSGNLEIEVARNTLHLTVGGLTLEAVPEPSTALLSGIAGLGLLARRRK